MIVPMRPPLLIAGLLALTPAAAQEAKTAPAHAVLAARAKQTRARLAKEAAAWRVVHEASGGTRIVVDVLHTSFAQRRILSVALAGETQPREMLRVISREGAWYVNEVDGVRGIYRPRQAPFVYSLAYRFLDDAGLVTVPAPQALGTYRETRQGRAAYQQPLPLRDRRRLEGHLRQLERIVTLNTKLEQRLRPRIERARQALKQGQRCEVELKTGLVRRRGPPDRRVLLTRFQFLKSFSLTSFAMDGPALVDRRALLAKGRENDLLMLAHCGFWRPGKRAHELDGRLVDRKTGHVRRIPFEGALCLPGCFLKDRQAVVVGGVHPDGIGLFRVDLGSGANRRLGGAALAKGVCFSPALAPDGKQLALLHMPTPRHARVQPYVVDMKSGAARAVGASLVAKRVTWFPDGKALLIERRVAFSKRAQRISLLRLDLAGKRTELREGGTPVRIRGGKAILFQHQGVWKTCDLGGKQVALLGGGLKGYAEPSSAPGGSSLVFVRGTKVGPRPLIVDARTGRSVPLNMEKPLNLGLWGFPAWR